MKRSFWGTLIFFLLAGASSSAWAVDGAEAYLPVDFVICSDPAVLKANEAHEKAWYETRARLNDAEKQELLEDQRRWLREFPPHCSVPAQGKSLATISKDTQLCVMRALEDRQAFLKQYHNHAREGQSSTQTAAQPTETQAATGSMPSGQSSAAGAASDQSPSANKQTKDEISIDISKYACQDMITDAHDNNGSKAAVAGAALIIAYTHAHDKLFPNNTTYNLDIEKFANTVEQNCEAGERSLLVENVVENLLKQDRNSATAARSPANVPVIAQQDWQSRNFPPPNPGLLVFTFIDGNPACASYNGRDCLWGQNENQIDFSRVKPLICGEKHRQIWGGTGYDDPRHWCSLARGQAARPPAATRPAESQAAASALSQSAVSCAKFTSLANSALNSMFGTTNYSGSWVPVIINIAKGDRGSGHVVRKILAEHMEAGNSIAQFVAAFLASEGSLFNMNGTTVRALLLGLALEPQSIQTMDSVIVQATIRRYGVETGLKVVRSLAQEVIDQVAAGAGQQSEQVRTMIQANLGTSGKICTND